jgi:hypothetical protein
MKRSVIAVLAMLTGMTLLLVCAYAQEDMEQVDNSDFGAPRRPAAVFFHDQHNETAGIDDCAECHHVWDEQGKKVEGESSEGTPCSECHALKDEGPKPGLRKAFHLNCKGCHMQQGKGPVTCNQCHQKK